MGTTGKISAQESDVTIVVVTGRTNGHLKNLLSGQPLSYQSYSSTRFSLHRNVLCDGPRGSTVLKTLFALSGQQARLEIDLSHEEAQAFPRLVDHIYHGTPMSEDDSALVNLAARLDVPPESAGATKAQRLVSSTKVPSESTLSVASKQNELSKAQSTYATQFVQNIISNVLIKPTYASIQGIYGLLRGIGSIFVGEVDVEADVAADVEADVEADGEAEVEAEVVAEVDAEVEAEVEAEVDAEVEAEVEAEMASLEDFQRIRDGVLRVMRSDTSDAARKYQSQTTLKKLLAVPIGQEHQGLMRGSGSIFAGEVRAEAEVEADIASEVVVESKVATLEDFQRIPDLLRAMKSDTSDAARKHQSQTTLKKLLAVPIGQEHQIATIVNSAGTTPSLLEILSSNQYTSLHLAAVKMLKVVASDSEFHASRLEKSLVIEKMIECQRLEGLNIRIMALEVIASIGMHSKDLCRRVLKKRGCLMCILVACKRKETTHAAMPLLHQFCKFVPQEMLREDVVELIKGPIMCYSNTWGDYEAASSSFVNLAKVAVSDGDGIFRSIVFSVSYKIRFFEEEVLVGDARALRGRHALRVFTQLVHKPFILRSLCYDIMNTKERITQLLWSPCREVQLLTCSLVAALSKSLRKNDTWKREEKWCKTGLLPPLVDLLSREGATRVPTTMAITDLICYSNAIAKAFVDDTGIPLLCDVLSLAICNKQEELERNILLALQRLVGIKNGTTMDAGAILHSFGTNLARAMLTQC